MRLFVGMPTYCGIRYNTMQCMRLMIQHEPFKAVLPYEVESSLLAHSFNKAWAQALMVRKTHDITHFLLWHADIVPLKQDWLKRLHDEMRKAQAKVISVVSPIKDDRGLTSIALDTDTVWSPRRFTMKEIAQKPVTWTEEKLLVNTGMLLIDIREPWVNDVFFTINDGMYRNEQATEFVPVVEPEDWHFSRQCHRLGIPVYATKAVEILHRGSFNYPNFGEWGRFETDQGDVQKKIA